MGRRSDQALEVLAQVGGAAKPASAGHDVDRQVGRLEQPPGEQDPLAQQPLVRRGAGRGPEPPCEGPGAHGRPAGHVVDAQRFVEVLLGPLESLGKQVLGRHLAYRLVYELGLAAVAVGWNDHPTGQHIGDLRAEVHPHDVQAQVDTGSRARRGVDIVIVDVKHVGIHLDQRVATGQLLGVCPMRCSPAPVEQAGGRQGERTRAHRQDPGAAGVGSSQSVQQLGMGFGRPPRGRHHNGIRPPESVEAVGRVDRETGLGHDRRWIGGAHQEAVPRNLEHLGPVNAEDLARDSELER